MARSAKGLASSFIYTFIVAPEVRYVRMLNSQPATTGSDGSFRYRHRAMASSGSSSTGDDPGCDKSNMEILASMNQYGVHDCWLAVDKKTHLPVIV